MKANALLASRGCSHELSCHARANSAAHHAWDFHGVCIQLAIAYTPHACACTLLHTPTPPPAHLSHPTLQDSVEDTKGNNGVAGELTLTNLRLIWVNKKLRRTNISVGYGSITSISIMPATSRLKGGWVDKSLSHQVAAAVVADMNLLLQMKHVDIGVAVLNVVFGGCLAGAVVKQAQLPALYGAW